MHRRHSGVGHSCAECGDGDPDMAAEDEREDNEDVEKGARERVILSADRVHAVDIRLDAVGVKYGFRKRKDIGCDVGGDLECESGKVVFEKSQGDALVV